MGTTVSTELVDTGEKRGRDGRRYVATERRREWLAMFRRSGLTRRAFARQEGIRYTTFCSWLHRWQVADGHGTAVTKPTVRFTEVTLPSGAVRSLEVRLPDGTTVRGGRVGELAALVRALRG
jgi:hypothetical protein